MGKDNTIIYDPGAIVSMCECLSGKVERMGELVKEIDKANDTFFDDYCEGKTGKQMKKKASKTVDALEDGLKRMKKMLDSINKTSEKFNCAEEANKASIGN